MKKASLILALLVAASPLASIAQSQNELPTNLSGITTTAAPPEGFDPARASDADLAYYGFPPRPNDYSGNYESWAKAMASAGERITPTLEQTNIYHGPLQKASGEDNALESFNWSGFAHLGTAKSYGKSSYSFVYANITVPTANVADGTCTDKPDFASGWVGIDGDDSNDVLQDGIEFDAICDKGVKSTFYAAWFEWFPFSEVRVGGFPIAPGQKFFVEVWSTSATAGHAFIENVTKGKHVTINFSAPKGTKLIGNSAEFITERPGVNGGLATLTNYGSQTYSDAMGETFSGIKIDPGDSKAIIMLDNNHKPISFPTLKSATSFVMKDEGSAK
jgi:Peptidase A4 family